MRLQLRRRPTASYTHRATAFMDAAGITSRELGHDYLGTEHLLLALSGDRESVPARALLRLGLSSDQIRADIVALVGGRERPRGRLDVEALATLGIDLDEVRRRVEQAFGPGALERTKAGCTPVCPRLKRALELAVREAGELPLRPEHALLGIAWVEDSVAAGILASHGITVNELRASLAGEPPGELGT
jgi:ATP-dependent Clp protease ATP-binding subunit ClpA